MKSTLEENIGYSFRDPSLLKAALTHRSGGEAHNERLEFLGDSILNFVIAEAVFKQFPTAKEGELTRLRALLVRGQTAAEVAKELNLGQYLYLGIGELKSGGFQRGSILADALEALIGAIYLEAGLEECRRAILGWYSPRLSQLTLNTSKKDPKTQLQEYLQSQRLALPVYTVIAAIEHPQHPLFKVSCLVPVLEKPTIGEGNSRRHAEQNAARAVLQAIHHE